MTIGEVWFNVIACGVTLGGYAALIAYILRKNGPRP